MKKLFLITLFSMSLLQTTKAQESTTKYIEVTGSAQLEVTPDQIIIAIGIQEYWKEKFETGKNYKDYNTNISLEIISQEVITKLAEIGISKDMIVFGKIIDNNPTKSIHYKKSQTLKITLTNFEKLSIVKEKLTNNGISFIRIEELKNKDLNTFIKKTKTEALKNADEKAKNLLEIAGYTQGKLIAIIDNNNNNNSDSSEEDTFSKASHPSSSLAHKPIIVKYMLTVRYEFY